MTKFYTAERTIAARIYLRYRAEPLLVYFSLKTYNDLREHMANAKQITGFLQCHIADANSNKRDFFFLLSDVQAIIEESSDRELKT